MNLKEASASLEKIEKVTKLFADVRLIVDAALTSQALQADYNAAVEKAKAELEKAKAALANEQKAIDLAKGEAEKVKAEAAAAAVKLVEAAEQEAKQILEKAKTKAKNVDAKSEELHEKNLALALDISELQAQKDALDATVSQIKGKIGSL